MSNTSFFRMVILYLVTLNVVTFLLYGIDKCFDGNQQEAQAVVKGAACAVCVTPLRGYAQHATMNIFYIIPNVFFRQSITPLNFIVFLQPRCGFLEKSAIALRKF